MKIFEKKSFDREPFGFMMKFLCEIHKNKDVTAILFLSSSAVGVDIKYCFIITDKR